MTHAAGVNMFENIAIFGGSEYQLFPGSFIDNGLMSDVPNRTPLD